MKKLPYRLPHGTALMHNTLWVAALQSCHQLYQLPEGVEPGLYGYTHLARVCVLTIKAKLALACKLHQQMILVTYLRQYEASSSPYTRIDNGASARRSAASGSNRCTCRSRRELCAGQLHLQQLLLWQHASAELADQPSQYS